MLCVPLPPLELMFQGNSFFFLNKNKDLISQIDDLHHHLSNINMEKNEMKNKFVDNQKQLNLKVKYFSKFLKNNEKKKQFV